MSRGPSRFILVDGNNLLYRAYYVHVTLREKRGDPPLLSPSGYPTGLIHGAISMLSDWIQSVSRPTQVVFFLDGIPVRRLAMDPSYKLRDGSSSHQLRGRDIPVTLSDGHEATHDLDALVHILRLLGVDVYHGPEEEADDLIASFVKSHPRDVHIIVSSDRDYYSILDDNVVLYRPGVDGNRFFDAERATEDMRKVAGIPVPPSGIRLFKSLVGDASDKIPGVPRLRKKVAAGVSHYGDISSLYASGFPGFSASEKVKTESARERVELNYELVGIVSDIELTPFLSPSLNAFDTGVSVLRELGISGVGTFAFRLGDQPGMPILGPSVPDWLLDV